MRISLVFYPTALNTTKKNNNIMNDKNLSKVWDQVFVNLGFTKEDDGWVLQIYNGRRLDEELYLCVSLSAGMPSSGRHFDIQLEDMCAFTVNHPQNNLDIKELIDKILNWSCDVFIATCNQSVVANTETKAREMLMERVKMECVTLRYSDVCTHTEEHLNCVYELVDRALAELEVARWSEK